MGFGGLLEWGFWLWTPDVIWKFVPDHRTSIWKGPLYVLYDLYVPCMTVSFVWWIRNGSVLTSVASVHASPRSFCHILDFCVCESDCVELWVVAIQCAYYLPAARADTTTWLDTVLFQYSWAFVRQCLLQAQSVALHQTCSSHPWHNWPSQTTWHWFEPPLKANLLPK